MEIKSAEFVISNTNVKKCPTGDLPEYAFIGRSNVGKSSLINMLTGKKGLAMTSQKPGKTLLINHFLINGQWYLVDLPGYGFAREIDQIPLSVDEEMVLPSGEKRDAKISNGSSKIISWNANNSRICLS